MKKEDGGVVLTFRIDEEVELRVKDKAKTWKVTFEEAFRRCVVLALDFIDFPLGRK